MLLFQTSESDTHGSCDRDPAAGLLKRRCCRTCAAPAQQLNFCVVERCNRRVQWMGCAICSIQVSLQRTCAARSNKQREYLSFDPFSAAEQMVRLDRRPIGGQYLAVFYRILQLADVAREGIVEHGLDSRLADAGHLALVLALIVGQNVAHQQGDVVTPIAKRGRWMGKTFRR